MRSWVSGLNGVANFGHNDTAHSAYLATLALAKFEIEHDG
jgi:hypothetical protein